MKLIKLFPMVALMLAMAVNSAFADTGKISKEETGGAMCEVSAARLAQKLNAAGVQQAVNPAPVKQEEPVSGATRAL